jgi:hypothetical protein
MHVPQFAAVQYYAAVKWDATWEFPLQFQDNPVDPWLYPKSPVFYFYFRSVFRRLIPTAFITSHSLIYQVCLQMKTTDHHVTDNR